MVESGGYKDTDLFPLRCPSCLHKFRYKVGRMKAGGEIWCPVCGATLCFQVEEFLRALGQLRRGLYDFKARFLKGKH
jgi:hypothetical protein